MSTGTPEQVLESIVEGINTGNIDALMTLYEPDAGLRVSQATSRTDQRGFARGWLGSSR